MNRLAAATLIFGLALGASACGTKVPSGTVLDRSACQPGTCLTIEHGDGQRSVLTVRVGQYAGCQRKTPWPECKNYE